MPTLTENPSSSPRVVLPSEVLLRRHRWLRWRWVATALLMGGVITLAALWLLHPTLATPGSWKLLGLVWAGGFVLSGLAALLAWMFAPRSLLETARQMDRDFTAKNRLEAIAALRDSDSPLARAQRDETAAYLAQAYGEAARPGRLLPWLVAALLIVLALHLATLVVWIWPLLHPPAADFVPPASKEPPKASFTWRSPEAQAKANPVEEVPTVAIAESNTGLKNITLEISVDGAPKKSVPVPAAPFDRPGKNVLKVSMYMDELGVEPFDIVSYYLRGVRVAPEKLPDTDSPIQFVQVRPFRDDVLQTQGMMMPTAAQKNQDLLMDLKLAELESVKENFVLAHTELPPGDPIRTRENKRVGQNQADLAKKTEQVAQAFTQSAYPPAMIDLLRQAESPMDEAGKKILTQQNNPALPPQQKALSLIVAVEKYFHKVIMKGSPAPPPTPDPFKDKQQHELKDRSSGAAGQMEILSKNQAKLANDLNQPEPAQNPSPSSGGSNPSPQNNPVSPQQENNPAPSANPAPSPGQANNPAPSTPPAGQGQPNDPFGPQAGQGTLAERQARVLQGLGVLLNDHGALSPPAGSSAQEAQKEAGDSQHSLDQNDTAGAQEPAAQAAQTLQHAVEQMNQAGEAQTKQAMQDSQQQMNDLERQLRDLAQHPSPDASQRLADAAQQVQNLQDQLEHAADHQQSDGSAAGAQRINQLAQSLAGQKIASNLSDLSKKGMDAGKTAAEADKLTALAEQAAQNMLAGKPSAQDLTRLADALEANRANLEHLAQRAGGESSPQNNPANPGSQGNQGQQNNPNGQGNQPSQTNQSGQRDHGQQGDQGKQGGQGQQGSQGQQGTQGQQGSQGQSGSQGQQGSGGSGNSAGGGGIGQAFRDVMANVKDLAQQAEAAHPSPQAKNLLQLVTQESDTQYKAGTTANVVHGYDAIAPPLDQLILDLKDAAAHAERDAVIKQPDLNEAPPAFRSAVSDYFESISKDYHPDASPKQ